jgi:hypothetical protein
MGIFSLVGRIVTLPGRAVWKGYKGLWWAFGDEQAAPADPVHAGAAEKRLDRTLRFGFGSTLAASAMMGMFSGIAVDEGQFSEPTGWALWAWSTGLAAVISIWGVKHVARQQVARNAAGWKGNAQAAAAGFKDMGRDVAGAAFKAKDVTVNAGKHAAQAGKQVVDAGRATAEYARRVKGWVRPRPS